MIVDIARGENSICGVWKIEESAEQLLAMLQRKDWYLGFLEQVKTNKRAIEWLACRVLLKELLGKECLVLYRKTGAPYIDEARAISFSHTKGYVAVQVSLEHGVAAVDIEYRSVRIHKIRSKYMSEEEERHVSKESETNLLLLHWCAKETLFKLLDTDAVDFREHLHIFPIEYALSGIIEARESRTSDNLAVRLKYKVTEDYVITYLA